MTRKGESEHKRESGRERDSGHASGSERKQERASANGRESGRGRNPVVIAWVCACIGCAMLGLSFASVPLYDLFCRITGYGGTVQKAETSADRILDKKIKVRFDANVSGGLDWEFEPLEREVTVAIGETKQVFYRVKNKSETVEYGTASFNVSPPQSGAYFNKMACFCFVKQELKPNESMDMAIVFFVDPDIVTDSLMKDTNTITLSYTFFPDEADSDEAGETDSLTLNEKTSNESESETSFGETARAARQHNHNSGDRNG